MSDYYKSNECTIITIDVATLTLGSQPKQGLAKVWVESEA